MTEFIKVGALAQAHDLPIAPHGDPELHVQLAAALPNALLVEYSWASAESLWSLFFPHRVALVDGAVAPAPRSRPGFWFELDEARLRAFRVPARGE